MRVLTVVGTRPEFIKAAPVSRALRDIAEERLVSTGQHYDAEMSRIFVDDLELQIEVLPTAPSTTPMRQLIAMMDTLSGLVTDERPDLVIVYGDTNTTLAGALTASTSGIPLAHIEAGLRSFDSSMPEERNRVVTDHLANLLFCPSEAAVANLRREGIGGDHVQEVGDVNLDALLQFQPLARPPRFPVPSSGFALFTLHRQANVEQHESLARILEGVAASDLQTIWPLHPRTNLRLREFGIRLPQNVQLCPPLGFLEFLWLLERAQVVITDSGGVQKEAYWLGTPCVTARNETEWVETVAAGWNVLVGDDPQAVARAIREPPSAPERPLLYGNGDASARIVRGIGRHVELRRRPRSRS